MSLLLDRSRPSDAAEVRDKIWLSRRSAPAFKTAFTTTIASPLRSGSLVGAMVTLSPGVRRRIVAYRKTHEG